MAEFWQDIGRFLKERPAIQLVQEKVARITTREIDQQAEARQVVDAVRDELHEHGDPTAKLLEPVRVPILDTNGCAVVAEEYGVAWEVTGNNRGKVLWLTPRNGGSYDLQVSHSPSEDVPGRISFDEFRKTFDPSQSIFCDALPGDSLSRLSLSDQAILMIEEAATVIPIPSSQSAPVPVHSA